MSKAFRVPGPRCRNKDKCEHYKLLGFCNSENFEGYCNLSVEQYKS